jgi:hypothetical protein
MPDTVLKHVWAGGMEVSDSVCKLHGWKLREARPQVFDAVLFSTELDLLELRWNEASSLALAPSSVLIRDSSTPLLTNSS